MRITVRLSGFTKIAALAVVLAAVGCGSSTTNGSGLNEGGAADGTTDGNSSGASSGASSGGDDGAVDGTLSGDGAGGDGTLSDDGSSSGSSSSGGPMDGGSSSGASSSGASSGGMLPDASPFQPDSGGSCINLGGGCAQPGDCCSGTCTGGSCTFPLCIKDGQSCTSSVQCCGGLCASDAGGAGTCAALPTGGCHSDGNSCAQNSDCCSMLCSANGTCQPSSFCQQTNDTCGSGKDCCSGICNVPDAGAGLFGTCAPPPTGNANCTMVDGTVCGGVVTPDSGASVCGGSCCSRLCAPFGPTGVLVCQPASGCHVVGDICSKDSDCCGDHTGQCTIAPGARLGICQNPGFQNDAGHACIPSGDVCTLGSVISCSASCDCCSGNCNKYDTCRFDTVGVPRCTEGPSCVGAGQACTSSADCCGNVDGGTALPCVPNPGDAGPPFICFTGGACVRACGGCTVNADCCAGETCVVPQGSTSGTCGPCNPPPDGGTSPEGGGSSSGGSSSGGSSSGGSSSGGSSGGDAAPVCALYGQLCSVNSDCCNGIPCTGGRCLTP